MNQIQKRLVPRKFRVRHSILEIVFNKAYGSPNRIVHEETIAVPVADIAVQLNLSETNVHYVGLSLAEDEIKFCEFNRQICVVADKDTFAAFTSEKYLNEGWQKRITRFKDLLTITVSIIAIASAIWTARTAISKGDETRKELDIIKKEVLQLKSQSKQDSLSSKK